MTLRSDGTTFLGTAIDHYSEPWYRFDRIISMLDRYGAIPASSSWLDVGCQLGQFFSRLRARCEVVPTGIDNFAESNLIEVCAKYFNIEIKHPSEVLDGSWRYLTRLVDKEGFGVDEKFDYISALEILEHMIDTDAFLQECRDHLVQGGYLVISTPNINSFRNRIQVPFGAYPAGMEYRNKIHHVRLYNAPALKSHLSEHGFELVALAGVSFLPARWLRHKVVRIVDSSLSDLFPAMCGNLIGIFRLRRQA